jgi:putative flippase GtrA
MQNRLMVVLFIIVATVFMGAAIVAALNTGHGTGKELIVAALAGCVLALPVAYVVSRKMTAVLKL